MTEGNFVDYVKLQVASGNGGKGSVHLHREKYITKGGPDGGDGGRGGHVLLSANKICGRSTVLNFKSTLKQATGAMEVKTEVLGLKGKIL